MSSKTLVKKTFSTMPLLQVLLGTLSVPSTPSAPLVVLVFGWMVLDP